MLPALLHVSLMKYRCYSTVHGKIGKADFLNAEAKQYLQECDSEIFECWKERNRPLLRDVSLAYTINNTLLKKFKMRTVGISEDTAAAYSVVSLFQHTNDTTGKIADMFYEAKSQECNNVLVLTQSPEFKSKFNYDTSTITLPHLANAYQEFVDFFSPPIHLRLFIVELVDIDFESSIYRRGDKEYLKISYAKHS